MTKADLVDKLYSQLGFPKREAQDITDLLFTIMKEKMREGQRIKLSGFGNFIVREKKARKGRNPQNGEAIEIAPRRVLVFKASQVLRMELN
jgi:integration host factor subunit alpha